MSRYARRMAATRSSTCPRCKGTIQPGQIITKSPKLRGWIHVGCTREAQRRTARATPYRREAAARWPDAGWIAGEGRWATLAWCDALTVQLHATRERALVALATIDRMACGGACTGRHELVDLEQDDDWPEI